MDMRLHAQLIVELQEAIAALEGKISDAFDTAGEEDVDSLLIDEAMRECGEARRKLGTARETLARYQGLKLFEEMIPIG